MFTPLVIRAHKLLSAPDLQPGSRGSRRIVVEAMLPEEFTAFAPEWEPMTEDGYPTRTLYNHPGGCTEMSYFTESARQDHHYHFRATEIYMVMGGTVTIQVEATDYVLDEGDTLLVPSGLKHLVKSQPEHPFLCRVIAINHFPNDKSVV